MATLWLSPFSGVARACTHAHMIFTSVKKRCGKLGRYVSFNKIHALYISDKCTMINIQVTHFKNILHVWLDIFQYDKNFKYINACGLAKNVLFSHVLLNDGQFLVHALLQRRQISFFQQCR